MLTMNKHQTLLAIILAASSLSAAEPKPTLTAVIKSPTKGPELSRFTNVVSVAYNHEKKDPPCHLIRYVENGVTNEFHARNVSVTLVTNTVAR